VKFMKNQRKRWKYILYNMYIYIFLSNFGGLCTSPQKKNEYSISIHPSEVYFFKKKGVGLSKKN